MTPHQSPAQTPDRDPELQALFAQDYAEVQDPALTALVMKKVQRERKKKRAIKISMVLVLVALAWGFSDSLGGFSLWLSATLNTPIIGTSDGLVDQMVSPMNSYAFAFVVIGLALNKFRKKLFR